MTKKIDIKKSLYELANTNTKIPDLLLAYEILDKDSIKLLDTIGKQITLENALKSKKIDILKFTNKLEEILNTQSDFVDSTLKEDNSTLEKGKMHIEGILPCPVRIPLLEGFEKFLETQSNLKENISYELKAASMGVDWLKDSLSNTNDENKLADMFLSAGFDLFFDDNLIGKFKKRKVFSNQIDFKKYNTDFDNAYISIQDPKNDYSIIGVVPAVFLVNTSQLNGRTSPNSWG